MEKRRFIKRLRKALHGVPQREIDNLVDYYSELIDDKYERGYSSREIFRDLKDPEEIADEFRRENSYAPEEPDDRDREPRRRRRRKHSLAFYIIFSPFLLAFAIVGFALGLIFSIAGFAIVAAVAVCGVAFQLGGLYAIGVSIPLFKANPWIALVQVGAGIALIGLGNLLCLAIAPCWRLYSRLIRWMFRGFRFSDRPRERRPVRTGKAVTAVIMCCLLVVGGIGGTVGFWQLDFDYKNLAVYDDYVLREESFTAGLEPISITGEDLYVKIVRTEQSEIKFTYYECEAENRTLTAENGAFNIGGNKTNAKNYFKNVVKRGLMYQALSHIYDAVTVELPTAFIGELSVESKNGYIIMEGGVYANAELKTSNGLISVKDCSFGALSVTTSNGLISLENVVSAAGVTAETSNGLIDIDGVTALTLSAKTDNGAISFKGLKSGDISLETHNGAIDGRIPAAKEEYTIDAKCSVGHCNIESGGSGIKKLYVRVSNGAIDIKFGE